MGSGKYLPNYYCILLKLFCNIHPAPTPNMTEVLSNGDTYVPNSSYLTQRRGTFLVDIY